MRLAADPSDPAYRQVAKGCRIFANGVEMSHLLGADEEAGEVERMKFDAAGSVRSEAIRRTTGFVLRAVMTRIAARYGSKGVLALSGRFNDLAASRTIAQILANYKILCDEAATPGWDI